MHRQFDTTRSRTTSVWWQWLSGTRLCNVMYSTTFIFTIHKCMYHYMHSIAHTLVCWRSNRRRTSRWAWRQVSTIYISIRWPDLHIHICIHLLIFFYKSQHTQIYVKLDSRKSNYMSEICSLVTLRNSMSSTSFAFVPSNSNAPSCPSLSTFSASAIARLARTVNRLLVQPRYSWIGSESWNAP